MTHEIPDAKALADREALIAHMRRYHPRSTTARLADELDAVRASLMGYPDSDLPSLAAACRRAADLFDEQFGLPIWECRACGNPLPCRVTTGLTYGPTRCMMDRQNAPQWVEVIQ